MTCSRLTGLCLCPSLSFSPFPRSSGSSDWRGILRGQALGAGCAASGLPQKTELANTHGPSSKSQPLPWRVARRLRVTDDPLDAQERHSWATRTQGEERSPDPRLPAEGETSSAFRLSSHCPESSQGPAAGTSVLFVGDSTAENGPTYRAEGLRACGWLRCGVCAENLCQASNPLVVVGLVGMNQHHASGVFKQKHASNKAVH